MKRVIVIAFIAVVCVLILLGFMGCIRPILPGSSVGIVYPANDAVVPTEFSVLGVAARWSLGVEVTSFLFLGAPRSYAALPGSAVGLFVDGTEHALSAGGNHHVFAVSLPPGDHTLGLVTPFGRDEITVHVTDEPSVRLSPFPDVERTVEAVDRLKRALFDFMRTSPSFSFSDDTNTYPFQKIFLAGDGAFVLFGAMKERFPSACEVRYTEPLDGDPTAGDIAAVPVIFTWDAAILERPVKLTAVETGGDRLYLVIVDKEALTVLSIFPDGTVGRLSRPLADIAPGLPRSVETTFFPEIRTRAYRDFLYVHIDTYRTGGPSGSFDLMVSGSAIETVDLGGRDVDGIAPDGRLITFYPAPFVGPFETELSNGKTSTKACFPLPSSGPTFSFTGGSVHNVRDFYPEHPRFEIAPLVPCAGCTKEHVPLHHGVAGDVTFGPDILRASLGGREAYFIMETGKE